MIINIVQYFKESSLLEKFIYFYILLLPAPYWYLSFSNKMVQTSDLMFLVLFPVWCLHKIRQKDMVNYKESIYLFVMIILITTVCSFVNSLNLFHSIVDWFGLLYLAALFLIIIDVINTTEKLKKLLIVFSCAAVITAMLGLGAFINYLITRNLNQLLFFYPVEKSVLFFPRIKSYFHTPNMFASFEHIGLATLFCLYFLIKKEKSPPIFKSLLITAVTVVIVSIFLAGSQILAGALLTIFIITWLFRGKVMTVVRYIVFSATFAIMVFAICATIWMIYPLKIDNDIQQRWFNIQINTAYSHHIIPSIYAISMFKEHPIFGVGMGTFGDRYPKYINQEIEKISSDRMNVPADRVLDPHNTYTGALAEWGVLGFFAMIILFTQLIIMLYRINKPGNSLLSDGLRFSLLAGFLGFLFNGLFIDIIMMRHLWIFMAIIFIYSKVNNEEAINAR